MIHSVEASPIDGSPLRIKDLFLSFLRLGMTAFGGPVMVAYVRDLAVHKKGWVSEASMRDGIALCQLIPGATVMQLAAYVGLRLRGLPGAAVCFVAFGLPAFVLMVALTALYRETRDVAAITSLFAGLQVIVVALVANATWNFGRNSVRAWQDAALALGSAVFLGLGQNPILCVCGAGALGLLLYRKAPAQKTAPVTHEGIRPDGGLRQASFLALAFLAGVGILYAMDPTLFDLAALMIRVDLFAFGGGFASVPLMLHEVVGVRNWMDSKTFMDGIALGQVTPGPIVITAAFVGYLIAGMPGALAGTVAVFTPSFIILTAAVPYFDRLQGHVGVRRAARGVLASFVGLLLAVTVRFGLAVPWTVPAAVVGSLALAALRMKWDVIWVVLAGAVLAAVLL
jgi:chromate transporter